MFLKIPFTNRGFYVPALEDLAIPSVCILIFFLAYTSQYLFWYIEPGPLSKGEAVWFNVCVVGIWCCYDQACTVDPGRRGWVRVVSQSMEENEEDEEEGKEEEGDENGEREVKLQKGMRWCKKCEAVKPPRAHHCRKCERCIPKMDHHCPWTSNCVSHTTFPHFIRFIFYATLSMSILTYHLITRLSILWSNRNLPSYLGPPVWAIIHLFLLTVINSFTLFALSILLIRAGYSMATNTTMIESWEIERHESLLSRARKNGGFVYANRGQKVRVQRQEFPYDIGIWKNLVRTFGTKNVFLWVFPYGGGPDVESAGKWEENGFEDEGVMWPPLDPDKLTKSFRKGEVKDERQYGTIEEEKEAFKKRQESDYKRWNKESTEIEEEDEDASEVEEEEEEGIDGEPGWTNLDGDRLRDYGVDSDAEIIADEDDIPLGELLRRRKARSNVDE